VVSIGIAPTKFVAKIASDIDKPDGLRVVAAGEIDAFLRPLPVARLWGAGAVTCERLTALGLRTIGQVADFPAATLAGHLGATAAAHLVALARGEDPRPVDVDQAALSIGHEETFERDVADREWIRTALLGQADRVAARLREAGSRARTVTLKIKYADFRLVTRRRTLADATSDGAVIGRVAGELLDLLDLAPPPPGADPRPGARRARGPRRPGVRLCGVSVSGLEPRDAPRQLTLDEERRARGERLGDALDAIARRYGHEAVVRAACQRDDDDD
jgi:DNA polymerase-4